MKAMIGMVGEGRIGLALAGLDGVTTAGSLEEVSERAGAILVEGESVARLEDLRSVLGPGPALFRVVAGPEGGPGMGAIVLCPEDGTAAEVVDGVADLLGGLGEVVIVPEGILSAAAAASRAAGSCLAVALEGMEEGAVEAGLPRSSARAFVRQTLLASALLLQDHPGSPADLKDRVASPGGTTIAGLASLEDDAARGAFIRAVEQVAERRPQMVRRDETQHG